MKDVTEAAAAIQSKMFVKDTSGPVLGNFYELVDNFSDDEFQKHFKMNRTTMEVSLGIFFPNDKFSFKI